MTGDVTRTMKARKTSICPSCKETIEAGEKIASKNRGRWVHARCSITWLCVGTTFGPGIPLYQAIDAEGTLRGTNQENVEAAIAEYAPERPTDLPF